MEEKVKKIFESEFKMEIDDSFDKFSTDKWDSFKHLDLIVAIEKEFDISFTPSEIGTIASYKDVITVLNNKLGGN